MSDDPHPILTWVPDAPPQHRKPLADLRTRRVSVPVSEAEYAEITRLACIHRCGRAAVLRRAVGSIPPPIGDRPALLQIRRVGINLNQLVGLAHLGFPVSEDLEPLLLELRDAIFKFLTPEARRD